MLKRLVEEKHLERGDEELSQLLRLVDPPKVDPFRKARVLVRIERARARRSPLLWPWSALLSTLLVGGNAAAELTQRLFRRSPPR